MADTNGAVREAAAVGWPHGFFEPREISGKGSAGDLPGKFLLGEESAGGALVDAVGGAGIDRGDEGGFCDSADIGDSGADVTAEGFASERVGNIAGTCARDLSVEGGDGLLGDALEGAFASNGVEDGLCADEPGGSAFSDIAKGEI